MFQAFQKSSFQTKRQGTILKDESLVSTSKLFMAICIIYDVKLKSA
jgi:hypothetical protein